MDGRTYKCSSILRTLMLSMNTFTSITQHSNTKVIFCVWVLLCVFSPAHVCPQSQYFWWTVSHVSLKRWNNEGEPEICRPAHTHLAATECVFARAHATVSALGLLNNWWLRRSLSLCLVLLWALDLFSCSTGFSSPLLCCSQPHRCSRSITLFRLCWWGSRGDLGDLNHLESQQHNGL